jgi:hypothetical protein
MVDINDYNTTNIPSVSRIVGTSSFQKYSGIYLPEISRKFKKNDTVRFRFRKKEMSGKITKIGAYGVDVRSSNGYYYLYDYGCGKFNKACHTKNYK